MPTEYHPCPIDTGDVVIGQDLETLVEMLAENAHDIWARQRLAAGWTLGERRCDPKLKHPCLVPYRELPESEKDYDRQIVRGTVKAILALGYAISPSEAR